MLSDLQGWSAYLNGVADYQSGDEDWSAYLNGVADYQSGDEQGSQLHLQSFNCVGITLHHSISKYSRIFQDGY